MLDGKKTPSRRKFRAHTRFAPALTLLSQKNVLKINKKAKLQSISKGTGRTPRTLPIVLESASSGGPGHYRQERKCYSVKFTGSSVGKKRAAEDSDIPHQINRCSVGRASVLEFRFSSCCWCPGGISS